MKILSVHNSYQLPGGEDQVFAQEADLLLTHGHQVAFYQASNHQVDGVNRLVLLGNTVWNRTAYDEIRKRIRHQRPDVVHVHNTFPMISPAVYDAARHERVPVVQTLHNYRLLCPAATLFRNGRVCEDCVGKTIPLPGVVHGCYRGSHLATAAAAAMMATQNVRQTWNHSVSAFIALTAFARNKFIEGGLPAAKIVIKPNYLQSDPGAGSGRGNYALFVGRLTPEKGVGTLLAAWRSLGSLLPLHIAGDGPMAREVEQAARENDAITWLRWQPRADILQQMKDASVLILPSTWYEGFPMVLAEAFAVGLPVIASNLGSMASIIEHRRTGLHFAPGKVSDLVEKVCWFMAHSSEVSSMRSRARAEYETKYTAEVNYRQLMHIYQSLLQGAATPLQSQPLLVDPAHDEREAASA